MKRITIATLAALTAVALPASLAAADAQENWTAHCAKCHAADGSGKTKVGAKLKLKDYTSAEAQKAFTDEEAFKAIKEGVKEGDKFTMNGYAEKLSDDEIHALVALVRGMAK